jgi:alkylation response protein AidB-like acyl-CoA dehydrogenase
VDFELTDDQLELQQVVRDVAERECPPALIRSVIDGGDDVAGLWKTFVQLDWPSLTVPADDGGMGLTAVELVITLEELGWVADPTPFLATTTQYVPLVREAASAEQSHGLLGAVCAGSTGAAAFTGDVRAERSGDDWVLHGTARHVLDGDRADSVAVVADADDGTHVFVVPGGDARATRSSTFDATLHVADVVLDGTRVPEERALLGGGGNAVDRVRHEAVTGLAATMVGASRRILDMALGHVRERKQFGVPIGSFQAVKHMAVDAYVAIERARALCHFAALAIAEDDERRAMAASMAKAAAGDCQRVVARHGIQLFGGLGFTWENDLHLYVRRAKAGELLLGSTADHHAAAARAALAAHTPHAPHRTESLR